MWVLMGVGVRAYLVLLFEHEDALLQLTLLLRAFDHSLLPVYSATHVGMHFVEAAAFTVYLVLHHGLALEGNSLLCGLWEGRWRWRWGRGHGGGIDIVVVSSIGFLLYKNVDSAGGPKVFQKMGGVKSNLPIIHVITEIFHQTLYTNMFPS